MDLKSQERPLLKALLTWQHHLYLHGIGAGAGCWLPQGQDVPPPDLHLALVCPLIGRQGTVDVQPEGGASFCQLGFLLEVWLCCPPGHSATGKDPDQLLQGTCGPAGLEEPQHRGWHLLQAVAGVHLAEEFKTLPIADGGDAAPQRGVQPQTCSGGESPWHGDRSPVLCHPTATLPTQPHPRCPRHCRAMAPAVLLLLCQCHSPLSCTVL